MSNSAIHLLEKSLLDGDQAQAIAEARKLILERKIIKCNQREDTQS